MLNFANLSLYFWAEVVQTACFVQNRSIINKRTAKIPYEGLNKKRPDVKFFHIFGCRCFVLNKKDHLGKFEHKADEAIFLGYSMHRVAYRVLNRQTRYRRKLRCRFWRLSPSPWPKQKWWYFHLGKWHPWGSWANQYRSYWLWFTIRTLGNSTRGREISLPTNRCSGAHCSARGCSATQWCWCPSSCSDPSAIAISDS